MAADRPRRRVWASALASPGAGRVRITGVGALYLPITTWTSHQTSGGSLAQDVGVKVNSLDFEADGASQSTATWCSRPVHGRPAEAFLSCVHRRSECLRLTQRVRAFYGRPWPGGRDRSPPGKRDALPARLGGRGAGVLTSITVIDGFDRHK